MRLATCATTGYPEAEGSRTMGAPREPRRGLEPADGFVRSLLADDPTLADLLDDFVAGLPARMAAVAVALEAGALDRVASLAHSAKGATASYGFPGLAALALRLEEAARAGDAAAAGAAASDLAAGCAAAVAAR